MMEGFVKRPDDPILYTLFRDIRVGPLGPINDVLDIVQKCNDLRDRLICW